MKIPIGIVVSRSPEGEFITSDKRYILDTVNENKVELYMFYVSRTFYRLLKRSYKN